MKSSTPSLSMVSQWTLWSFNGGVHMQDKKQQLIDSVSYEDFKKFKEDYERKMERGEVEQVPLNVIIHKYFMHKEYMFEVDLDYKTYHKLRQHIEFLMLI